MVLPTEPIGSIPRPAALIEGIHFEKESTSAEALGWKALAVNLSDIAAMGGNPGAAIGGMR